MKTKKNYVQPESVEVKIGTRTALLTESLTPCDMDG